MKIKIHWFDDDIIIESDSVEDIRNKAFAEIYKRGWREDDCWSEEVK